MFWIGLAFGIVFGFCAGSGFIMAVSSSRLLDVQNGFTKMTHLCVEATNRYGLWHTRAVRYAVTILEDHQGRCWVPGEGEARIFLEDACGICKDWMEMGQEELFDGE